MQHIAARVLSTLDLAENLFALDFQLPTTLAVEPGQFLTIRVGNHIAPLLRRPFAFSDFDAGDGRAQIVYEKRGRATDLLTGVAPGDTLDLLAPLGNRFPLPNEGRRPVLVAGGIGLGPLIFFFHELVKLHHDPVLIVGARSAERIPKLPLMDQSLICTDDGSRGLKGTVVLGLDTIRQTAGERIELYACGPHPMMHAVHDWADRQESRPPVWVSMEQTMGCAVGACMGCVVPVHTPKQFARVCVEGPVFTSSYIAW